MSHAPARPERHCLVVRDPNMVPSAIRELVPPEAQIVGYLTTVTGYRFDHITFHLDMGNLSPQKIEEIRRWTNETLSTRFNTAEQTKRGIRYVRLVVEDVKP